MLCTMHDISRLQNESRGTDRHTYGVEENTYHEQKELKEVACLHGDLILDPPALACHEDNWPAECRSVG